MMPYNKTFNQIVQHLRAKTALINLVVDNERILDYLLKNSLSAVGLSEINEGQTSIKKGPPVVYLYHTATTGLCCDPVSISRLNSEEAKEKIRGFIKLHHSFSVPELILQSSSDTGGINASPYELLYKTVQDIEKEPRLRFVLVDYDSRIQDVMTRRAFLNHAKQPDTGTVILVTTDPIEDPVIRTYAPVIFSEIPSKEELQKAIERIFSNFDPNTVHLFIEGGTTPESGKTVAQLCANMLSGLHISTALQILMLHMESPECMRVKENVVEYVINPQSLAQEKAEILNKAGYVTLINTLVTEQEIGGLFELKRWLHSRKQGFSQEAQKQKLRPPRGVLLVGPPGTAKSMCARLTASLFKMPLIRLDVGALFNSRLGNSERNVRNALQVADASAPCVLWVDEIDKGMGNMSRSGESDGGTSARIMGTLLTWMAEKTSPVFVIATANSISALPPEITRKGRMDEVFFVALPDTEERKCIWKIHLNKVNQNHFTDEDLAILANKSDGFSGAEIEQTVHDALYDAYEENKELKLTTENLLNALSAVVPLAKARSRDLLTLQKWALENARHASLPPKAFRRVEQTDKTFMI